GIRDFHVTGVQTCALPIYNLLPCPWTELCAQVRTDGESLARSALPIVQASERAVARAESALGVMLSRRLSRSRSSHDAGAVDERSEERRVGKECRSRWWRW